MARTRGAQGSGTIRQRTDGRWEARYTIGRDAGTGKQIQRSVYGKTQKEVRQKLAEISVEMDNGTYTRPQKIKLSEWLDIWLAEYLGGVKPRTLDSYQTQVETHIKPALGLKKLSDLAPHDIQRFYNTLTRDKGLSPKSVKNVHGVLHKALEQAVKIGYIKYNPSSVCELPRIERKEIKPLNDEEIAVFLQAIQGHKYEAVYLVTLFTGMRQGEVLGLTWDCIDFKHSTITVKQQLQKERRGNGEYHLVTPKNGKIRRITAAPFVMNVLRQQQKRQFEWQFKAHEVWENSNLVFTNETGHNLSAQTVYLHFKKIATACGFPDARFHDLRHSYAVAALHAGDDIKTVQENLGHHTAAFTLDVYGHVTDKMKQESADRMELFINSVQGKKVQ